MTNDKPPKKSLSGAFHFAVRKATASDLQDIVKIEKNSFSTDAWPKEAFAEELADPRSACFLATALENHAPAGYVLTGKKGRLGEIFSLAVHSDFRQQGLGQMLLDRACDDLRARGAGTINLEVRTNNEAAIRLYEKSGFTVTRTLPHYYEDGADALLMTLDCK